MVRGPDALVTPDLLRWAREEASYSIYDAAEKAAVTSDALESWEAGTARPSIPQARKLADVYRRPLAAFYLPAPPSPTPMLHDFRHQPGEMGISPTTLREIRRAKWRREIALELFDELGEKPPVLDAAATMEEDPEAVGARLRGLLSSAVARQFQSSNDYAALQAWRSALEALGVLVFLVPDVPLNEMLGFTLPDRPLPVIAANIKSHPRARIFTLIHEFAHLLIREGGICDLEEYSQRPGGRIEVYCNHVAGATLVPLAQLEQDRASRTLDVRDVQTVSMLARRYHVGREVIARRMLTAGWINTELFQQWRNLFQQEFRSIEASGGVLLPYRKTLSYCGKLFTRLVLEGYDEDRVPVNEVTAYLDIRPKYLSELRAALQKDAPEVAAA